MPEPRPSVTRFVDAISHAERARAGGARDGEVAARVLARLYRELGKLVGTAGFDVLLARSLVLARRDHPVLEGITVAPGGTLAGIDPGVDRSRDGAALEQGTLAIVSQLLELLVVLVGEALAMRLVRDVWPAAAEEDKQ